MQLNPAQLGDASTNNTIAKLIEQSLTPHIYWSAHSSGNCISTEWRVLPFMVLLSVREGEYRCVLDNTEKRELRAGAGSTLLIPAGLCHRLIVDQATVADGLHIHFTLFHNLDVFSFYELPVIITADKSAGIATCVNELTACLADCEQTFSISRIALKRSASFRLFYEIIMVSHPVVDTEFRFLQLNRILPALKVIESNLDGGVKVEALATACGLSRNAFSRLFKQITGASPLRFVNRKRLELAMSKLVYGDLPISEIARSVGFCDQFHFSKTFRAETGESPSQYRDSIRMSLPHKI